MALACAERIEPKEIVMRRISAENPNCVQTRKNNTQRATSFSLKGETNLHDGPSWSRLACISPNALIECGRQSGATQKQTVAFAFAADLMKKGLILDFRPETCDVGHFVLLSDFNVKGTLWSRLADDTLVISELPELSLPDLYDFIASKLSQIHTS